MTRVAPPATFYRASGYCADDSVGFLVRRVLMAITQAADKRLAPDGLTHVQWGPLFMLRQSRASTVAELARELQTDAGAMTRLLDRLEAKGLCRRERCTGDRRVVRIQLTAEGEAAASRVPAVLSQVMNEFLAGFSRAEWVTLKSLLQRMLDNDEGPATGEGDTPGDAGEVGDGEATAKARPAARPKSTVTSRKAAR
jgi:DNA-binding MarR family transcriptional regulator